MAEYDIIMADMGTYPHVFVWNRETGEPVFSSSYANEGYAYGYINAGVDFARMVEDETWFYVRDRDDDFDPELFEDVRDDCWRLGEIVDGVVDVMDPTDLTFLCEPYGKVCFLMAYNMMRCADCCGWKDASNAEEFCRDFLGSPWAYRYAFGQ